MYLVCIICPSPVGIGLTNLLNIGGRRGEVDNAVPASPGFVLPFKENSKLRGGGVK